MTTLGVDGDFRVFADSIDIVKIPVYQLHHMFFDYHLKYHCLDLYFDGCIDINCDDCAATCWNVYNNIYCYVHANNNMK